MKHFVAVDGDGFVVKAYALEVVSKEFAESHIEVPYAVDLNQGMWGVVNGGMVNYGRPPSPMHTMDRSQKKWVVDQERAWSMVRTERDRRLAETDWMITKANETGSRVSSEWTLYRQALRDVTKQSDPTNIRWPQKP